MIPALFKENPFVNEAFVIAGFTFAFICHGVTPTLEWTTTRPLVRSPYSAEGIPRITSTLSMLSAAIWRKSVPVKAVDENCPCVNNPLLEIGTPSTTMLEPKALVLLLRSVRSCRLDFWVMSTLPISLPGMSCMISANDEACKWSIAWRPIIDDVEAPDAFCFAVTTTSFNAKEVGTSCTLTVKSFSTLNVVV